MARDLDMVSSAVYRYFPSRDHLLTALIIDAYDAFGSKVIWNVGKALDWFDRKAVDGVVNAVCRAASRITHSSSQTST